MKVSKRMQKLLKIYRNTNPNDSIGIQNCWVNMRDALTVNYDETIEYIKSLNSDDLLIVSEVWDDLAVYWKTHDIFSVYVECIKGHSDIANDLTISFENAKEAYENDL